MEPSKRPRSMSLNSTMKRSRQPTLDKCQASDRGHILKVISGGQTGADRAALEAAYNAGLPTGGTVPCGFITSTGPDPLLGSKFGLAELEQPPQTSSRSMAQMYVQRSKQNVDDADATLAFRLVPSVGTDRTIGYCATGKWGNTTATAMEHRPCLVVSALNMDDMDAAQKRVCDFIRKRNVRVLNVAGHRDGKACGIPDFQDRVQSFLEIVFRNMKQPTE